MANTEAKTTELTIVNFDQLDLSKSKFFIEKEKSIKSTIKKNKVVKITDNKSYELMKESRTSVRTLRTSLEREKKDVGVEIKKRLNDKVAEKYDLLIDSVKKEEEKRQKEVSDWEAKKEAEKLKKENDEKERKLKLQSIVDVVATDLQSIIDSTKEFSQIKESETKFDTILIDFDDKISEKEIDLQEYDLVYQNMTLEKSEAFDALIKSLTTANDLEISNKALEVARLTNERMSELFDYDFKYKGDKALGELSIEEYLVEHLKAKKSFRIKEIEAIGLVGNESLKSWIYVTETDIILLKLELEVIEYTSIEMWEYTKQDIKKNIEEWNNPKEVEVNEIEVIEESEYEKENKLNEYSKETYTTKDNSELDKEAKENLENTICLEPKVDTSKYSDLYIFLCDTFECLATISEMQEIERIILKIQK